MLCILGESEGVRYASSGTYTVGKDDSSCDHAIGSLVMGSKVHWLDNSE